LRSLGGAVAFRAERGGKMRRARRSTKGGYSLSAEREYPPLHPPREREGRTPRPPTLAVSILKSCAACGIRCGVHGFAMNPYYSLPVSTAPYYREARVTMAQRQTSCGRGIAALAARGMKQMLQFVGTYDTVITRRCTNGRRLATSSERRW